MISKRILIIPVLFIVFLAAVLLAVSLREKGKKTIPNVIIMTFSGLRNMDSIEEPDHQYIPNLWNNIFKKGTLYTNLINTNYELHISIVQSINTGIDYYYWGRITQPSIFQYVRKKYALPITKLWMIGHFTYLNDYYFETEEYSTDTLPDIFTFVQMYISPQSPRLRNVLTKQELTSLDRYKTTNQDILSRKLFGMPRWDVMAKGQSRIFNKIMREFRPKLVHYVMNGTESAHYDTFAKYLISLKDADRIIFQTWEFINKDSFYKGNTYLIICVDHERDAYYKEHTSDSIDNPSPVWMYIYGPKVKKGKVIRRPVYHKDIFATVAYLMGVSTHPTKGKVLEDSFK